MRIYALLGLIVLACVAGCASNKPPQTPAAPPPPEAVKPQEATPQQRAQIKTDLAAGYYERGQFDVALQVLDDARSWMRPVMREASPRAEALYLGMCIERKQGDRQAEISYMTQLRNRYPDSPEAKALASQACE